MTSQPPQTPPSPPLPANDDAATAIAATTTNDNNNDHDLGPVTKLAAIAAAQAEADRIKQRKAVQASLQAHATLVGETAMAIAAATQHQQQQKSPPSPSLRSNSNNQHANANANAISMSPIRLSPKQKESLKNPLPGVVAGSSPGRSPGKRSNNNMNSNTNLNNQQQQQQQLPPKMSVAARARAAADLPPTQPRQDLVRRSSSSNSNSSRSRPELGSHAPSSGNAGVSRGKFSKQQVKQMIDEWGETSEDEDDDYDGGSGGEYSDEYYQIEGGGGGVGNTDRLGDEQYACTPNTKAYSHLQYTMSNSPGPKGSRKTLNASSSTSMSHEEDEDDDEVYHYQHHKVSSYSNYTPPPPLQQHDDANDNDNESSGGILSSAKNWLQSQRDRLHQMELERQVEDQRRKLVEEGRKERALEAEKRYRHRYYHGSPSSNSSEQRQQQQQQQQQIQQQQQHQPASIPSSGSFGCMAGEVGIVGIIGPFAEDDILQNNNQQQQQLQLQQQQNNNQTLSEGSGGMALCGFGGMYSNTNQLLLDDSTDYSGVARIDSQGNILEMIPSGSFDTDDDDGDDGIAEGGGQQQQHHHHHHMKVGMKVSSPKCTLSGQGMSVNVDLPDVMPCSSHDEKRKEDDYQINNHSAINNNKLDEEVDEHDHNSIDEEEVDATATTDDEDDPYFNTQIKIVPEPPQDEITGSAPILQVSQMKALISSGGLPPSLNFCKWKRLYNLTRDGDSFETFLRLVAGHERTVMVVKTTRGQLFGGYADTRWEARHVRQHAFEFYGSAQACLFRFPNSHHGKAKGKEKHRSREDKTIIYKWSGANRYIQLCDAAKRTVAFGGGGNEGEFGLCIEDDFRRGTTGHCSTFMNEALCEEGYFDVMDLEVWGFTLDF